MYPRQPDGADLVARHSGRPVSRAMGFIWLQASCLRLDFAPSRWIPVRLDDCQLLRLDVSSTVTCTDAGVRTPNSPSASSRTLLGAENTLRE